MNGGVCQARPHWWSGRCPWHRLWGRTFGDPGCAPARLGRVRVSRTFAGRRGHALQGAWSLQLAGQGRGQALRVIPVVGCWCRVRAHPVLCRLWVQSWGEQASPQHRPRARRRPPSPPGRTLTSFRSPRPPAASDSPSLRAPEGAGGDCHWGPLSSVWGGVLPGLHRPAARRGLGGRGALSPGQRVPPAPGEPPSTPRGKETSCSAAGATSLRASFHDENTIMFSARDITEAEAAGSPSGQPPPSPHCQARQSRRHTTQSWSSMAVSSPGRGARGGRRRGVRRSLRVWCGAQQEEAPSSRKRGVQRGLRSKLPFCS